MILSKVNLNHSFMDVMVNIICLMITIFSWFIYTKYETTL